MIDKTIATCECSLQCLYPVCLSEPSRTHIITATERLLFPVSSRVESVIAAAASINSRLSAHAELPPFAHNNSITKLVAPSDLRKISSNIDPKKKSLYFGPTDGSTIVAMQTGILWIDFFRRFITPRWRNIFSTRFFSSLLILYQ